MERNKFIYLAFGFAIIIICAVLFLFYQVSTIPDDAEQCLKNPIAYTENKMKEQKGYDISCYCQKSTGMIWENEI